MSYDPKDRVHRCDVCRRAMNDYIDLVDMRKPGERQPMMICAGGGCWDKANEAGYFSSVQRERMNEKGISGPSQA